MRGTTGGKSGGAAGIRGIAVAGASNGPAIAPSNQESRADQRDNDGTALFPRTFREARAPERAALNAMARAPVSEWGMWFAIYLGLRAEREQFVRLAIRGCA